MLRPPDENALDNLETFLKEPNALEYFYDYLKIEDDKEKNILINKEKIYNKNLYAMPTEVSFDPDDVNNDKPSRILSSYDGHLPSTSDVPKNITIDKTETVLSDAHSI